MNDNVEWVEPTTSQWTAFANSEQWAKGTVFQGQRLLGAFDKSSNLHQSISESPKNAMEMDFVGQLDTAIQITRYEEEFFLFALDRAIFSLKEAAKFHTEFQAFITEIETAIGTGQVKDVRDMRTHIDKYSKGQGQAQDRFLYESPEDLFPVQPFSNHLFAADATSTIVFTDAYLIGGRVNAQVAISTMEKLLPDIIETCHKYMFPPQIQR